MADLFKIEDISPETTSTKQSYSKNEEKIESVSMPNIQVPDYMYGNSQDTIDAWIAIRNLKSSTTDKKYCIAYKSTTTTVDSSGTAIVLDTYDTNDSGMNSSWTITITKDWVYNINSCVVCPTQTWSVYSTLIELNWSQYVKQSRYAAANFSLSLECNVISKFVVWDVLQLKYYATNASSETAAAWFNGQRMSVVEM